MIRYIVPWIVLVGILLDLVVNMKDQTRKRLEESASVGLDLSPGDPDIAEALAYIKALEEFEESVFCFFDDNPIALPENIKQAMLKVNDLQGNE